MQKLIDQCDQDLREGHGHLVAQRLQAMNWSSVAREFRLPLAAICRRAGLIVEGLKLLTPLTHADKNKWRSEATVAERAEYGALLMKHGSVREALRLLRDLPTEATAEVFMYRAFCHMARWDYAAAAQDLGLYLDTRPDEYAALVARVNLASSLIALSSLDEALELLNANIELASQKNYTRLLANSLELRAQVHLRARRWPNCHQDIDASNKILGLEKSADQLFIQKWKAVLEAFKTHSLDPLRPIRDEAKRRQHWESLRDLDRLSLQISFDDKIFRRLIFGTPYPAFREAVFRELNRPAPPSPFLQGEEGSPRLVLSSGEIHGLAVPSMNAQCLSVVTALLRDFYRPMRLTELFAELYPDNYFDIFSSPDRVRQVIRRSRMWLEENALPVEIEMTNGTYRLKTTGAFAFEVGLEREGTPDVFIQKLRQSFGSQTFTAAEAGELLQISRQKFQRWFTKAEAAAQIEKHHAGASTKYKLCKTG